MKIKYLPSQPHSMAFGGFEVQMLGTFDACKSVGVNVEKMDIWSRDSNYEILHCWGMDLYNFNTIQWAKKSGKKVVLTVLLSYYEDPISVMRHLFSLYITRVGKYYYSMVHDADIVVTLNEKQSDVLTRFFNIKRSKIRIVPNVVGSGFYENPSLKSNLPFAANDYLLTTGNICQRKNQVNLGKACLATGDNLLIIGNVMEGESEYAMELEKIIKNSNGKLIWIKGLRENSIELINYYQNCKVFCLPSHFEMQPISALEAAASGKPILIGKHAYAYQKYYKNAYLSDSHSVDSIVKGIKSIKLNPSKYIVPFDIISECKAIKIGEQYNEIYKNLID